MRYALQRATVIAVIAFGLRPLHETSATPNDFVLVRDGKARTRIVLKAQVGDEPAHFAATELQDYLERMSEAKLPIGGQGTADGAVELNVDPEALPLPRPTPTDPRTMDRYRLRVTPTGIQITGASGRAVLYGVYDFLERLGCGWCVPGDDTVPKRPTVAAAALEIDTTPAFRYRMMLDFPMRSAGQTIAVADWLAKNRMNWIHPCENAHGEPTIWFERRERVVPEIRKRGLNVIFGGHTMHTWCPETNAQEHPEWFALVDGQRKPPTLCVSNQEVVATVVQNMRKFLDRCPEVDVVDLWHPDGQVYCHCPKCTRGVLSAEGHGRLPEGMPQDAVHSAYVISYLVFINQVAAALRESHPKAMISPLIYGSSDRALPDTAPPLADNVLYGLAHIFRDSYIPLAGEPQSARNMRFLGNDLTWMAKARHHYIYEYYHCWSAPFIYPGAQVIVRDLQLMHELGVQGSSSDMYGYSPMNMYVAARALWEPQIDWQEVIRDFCRRFYGDVAEEMARNCITLEKGIYGKPGYQGNGALDDYWKWCDPACGLFLRSQRPQQIEFLESVLARTADSQVKVRLQRDLVPWKAWSAEPRWWALPDFEAGGPDTRPTHVEVPPDQRK